MGTTNLSIWFRQENCKPFPNLKNTPDDWITVMDCSGNIIRDRLPVPVGAEMHVNVDVPPGCYIIQGHVCGEMNTNDFTDRAIVMAGCNQDICVNLIVPGVKTCVNRDLAAFVREARIVGVPQENIATMTQTMLSAGRIRPVEVVADIERRIESIKNIKEAKPILKEYTMTLDLLRKLK